MYHILRKKTNFDLYMSKLTHTTNYSTNYQQNSIHFAQKEKKNQDLYLLTTSESVESPRLKPPIFSSTFGGSTISSPSLSSALARIFRPSDPNTNAQNPSSIGNPRDQQKPQIYLDRGESRAESGAGEQKGAPTSSSRLLFESFGFRVGVFKCWEVGGGMDG